jgi:hypothetical protein
MPNESLAERQRRRSSFVTTKKSPTPLQHLFALALIAVVILGGVPLYFFFAPAIVLSIVYFVGVGITLFVNIFILSEMVGATIWHHRCKKHILDCPSELGTRHTASLISAYLPNEPVTGLRESILASIRQERSPGAHHTVILGHNGGTEALRLELRSAIEKLRSELPPGDRPFVHITECYHPNSKSKAENVCSSLVSSSWSDILVDSRNALDEMVEGSP